MNKLFSWIAGQNYRLTAPLFLRLAIGFGFTAHGWAKLARGPEHFADLLRVCMCHFRKSWPGFRY